MSHQITQGGAEDYNFLIQKQFSGVELKRNEANGPLNPTLHLCWTLH